MHPVSMHRHSCWRAPAATPQRPPPLACPFRRTRSLLLSVPFILLVLVFVWLPLSVQAGVRDFSLNRQKVLTPSTPLTPGDLFGAAVTIDATGTLVAAGAPGSTSAQGNVYIFEINWHPTLVQEGHTTPNAWGHIQTVSASDPASGAKFGFSVSMSAFSSAASPTSVLVVGAPMATGGSSLAHAGKIYIFHRTGALLSASAWSQAASFSVGSLGAQYQETTGGCFGASVAAFGDYVIAGCPRCDVTEPEHALVFPSGLQQGARRHQRWNAGRAFVFKIVGGVWQLLHALHGSNSRQFDAFGCSVAVSSGIAVVGAMHNSRSLLTYDKEERLNSGAVYVYDLDDGSQTQFLTAMDTVIPGDVADDSVAPWSAWNYEFGRHVSLSTDQHHLAIFAGDQRVKRLHTYTRSSTAAKTFATPSCVERDMTPPSPAAAAAGAALLQDVFPGLPLQSSATDLYVVGSMYYDGSRGAVFLWPRSDFSTQVHSCKTPHPAFSLVCAAHWQMFYSIPLTTGAIV